LALGGKEPADLCHPTVAQILQRERDEAKEGSQKPVRREGAENSLDRSSSYMNSLVIHKQH
jgi:hypothetical protein